MKDGRLYPLRGWLRVGPTVRSRKIAGGLLVRTDARQYSYCLEYRPMRARASGTHHFTLTYEPRVGGIAFGILSFDRAEWLESTETRGLSANGRTLTLTVDLSVGDLFRLVVSNHHPGAGGASRFVVRGLTASVDAQQRQTGTVRTLVQGWLRRRMIRDFFIALPRQRPVQQTPEYRQLDEDRRAAVERLHELAPLAELEHVYKLLQERRPDHVHANGCGDFQLMAREHWFDLRAYPELETFSMNIDGLFEHIAHYAGIREVVLESPRHIYHLEHEKGSGWTPEGEALLQRRIAERGVPWVHSKDAFVWGAYMHWLRRPMIFNSSDWGFDAASLTETVIPPTIQR